MWLAIKIMIIGEPVLGPLRIPDIVMLIVGLIGLLMLFINKPPRPPALLVENQQLPNQVVL